MIDLLTSHAARVKNKSVYYGNRIIDRSLSCRDLIIDRSLSCRDLVMTTSLYCRDQLLDTVFGTLRDIPVRYKDGEFIVNDREYTPAASEESCESGGSKKIYVLLTKHTNITALLLRLFLWTEYTHSSIALERDGAHYSFNPVRGFTVERPIHKKRGFTPCRLYCVEVDDSAYSEIESRIKWFVDNPDEYKFNYAGLVFSILRIPVGFGNRYFCSQFVSDIITSTEAVELRKRPNRCFPRHFEREDSFTLSFHGEAADFTEDSSEAVLLDKQ